MIDKTTLERYERIKATQCDFCKRAKPNKKTDCPVRKLLIVEHDPAVVKVDTKFLSGETCRYYEPRKSNG